MDRLRHKDPNVAPSTMTAANEMIAAAITVITMSKQLSP
jgi:hypothetical protein